VLINGEPTSPFGIAIKNHRNASVNPHPRHGRSESVPSVLLFDNEEGSKESIKSPLHKARKRERSESVGSIPLHPKFRKRSISRLSQDTRSQSTHSLGHRSRSSSTKKTMVSLKGQEEEKLEMKKLGEKRRPNLGSRSLTQPRLEKQTADKELLLNSPKKFENPEIITRATRLSKRTKKPEISGKSSEQIQDVLLGNLTDNYQEKLTHPEKEIFHPEQYSTFEQSEHNQHNLLLEIILNLLKKFLEKYLRWNLIVKKVK